MRSKSDSRRTARYLWGSAGRARSARSPWVTLPRSYARSNLDHGSSPPRRHPAPASALIDVERLEREFMTRAFPTWRTRAARELRHERAPRHVARRRLTAAHILAITQAICDYRRGQGIDGPAVHGQGHARAVGAGAATALEVLAANGVETIIQRDDGVTPTPVISRAILVHNRGRKRAARRRHRHHAVAQSAGGRRLQVQPAERRPGRHRRHAVDPGPRQRAAARRQRRRQAHAVRQRRSRPRRRTRRISSCPTSTTWRNVIDMDAIRGAGSSSASIRSAARRSRYWEPIDADLRPRHHRRQHDDRSDVLLHDASITTARSAWIARARTRWRGLVGAEGSVSGRVRQRSRLRPPRHRHAVGRADEPESLPRGRDRLSADAPAGVAGDAAVGKTLVSSSMIDRVVQELGRRLVRGAGRASSGSRRACSTARAASAARRAPARASCAATAPCGRPTRTA